MNKLSIKIGIIFFFIIFSLEIFMFFFLHTSIVDSRVEEELSALQARGNSHRNILEKQFDAETISHVTLMESEANTEVVITDATGNVLDSSHQISNFKKYVNVIDSSIPRAGLVVEEHWKKEPYIATVSPIEQNGEMSGYVFMFQDTQSVHALIDRLNEHFLLAAIISISLTVIIIFFLSKALTKPLIKMKDATSQISKGNFDVTLAIKGNDELADLSQSIQLLANDLKYLKQERNEFLASISHELRTPLTYLKGYTDILLKRKLPIEEQQKYLTIIREESNRLSVLIKDLFELAKIDKNTFMIEKQPIPLHEFLTSIERKLAPAFSERNMIFTIQCPTNLFLRADPARLEQIILNLLDNAMKYSEEGSETTIKVSKNKHSVHLAVTDQGKGIPAEDLPYLFNRFYRVDKSRTRSLGGTGLGLAIVKELVDQHGGAISVKSELGKGTEFLLTFKE
ncbi:HAMP domain-containing histidine kinase [Mesobacillus maritimus]|uniref:sensor histidine kinase n=1 Tax=Mesobacillus maritimus TaxID=1643336 RepID=UPI00203F3B81|nr:HAMP domain-containing sensor histidine kinase [Mesobacillus maritimus]MCM3588347.1 HAMP domain-containing histidine kinase [Mesobacillus maritimus]